jgi:hypothetical protein
VRYETCLFNQGTGEILLSFHIDRFANLIGCEPNIMFWLRGAFFVVAAGLVEMGALCTPGVNLVAQTSPPLRDQVSPTPRLTLTAEQEYIIREIIFSDSKVEKENSAPETIGDIVPEAVKLYPLPPEVVQKVPQARSHMFFLKDDEIILVSSSDRKVADVIKKKPTD